MLARLEQDEDWYVRLRAAEALGRIGEARAVDGLLAHLAQDEASDVRESAHVAIINILNRIAPSPESELEAAAPEPVKGPWDG